MEGVDTGPQRSVWISSKTDFDLWSLLGKDFLMFLPRAHPMQMPRWSNLRLGNPNTIFPIEDKAQKWAHSTIRSSKL